MGVSAFPLKAPTIADRNMGNYYMGQYVCSLVDCTFVAFSLFVCSDWCLRLEWWVQPWVRALIIQKNPRPQTPNARSPTMFLLRLESFWAIWGYSWHSCWKYMHQSGVKTPLAWTLHHFIIIIQFMLTWWRTTFLELRGCCQEWQPENSSLSNFANSGKWMQIDENTFKVVQ